MFKDFIHIFVLSCKRSTFLMEKQMSATLSFLERIQLKMHLSICVLCREYNKKSILLDKLMQKRDKEMQNIEHYTEEELKEFNEKVTKKIHK